MHISHRKGLILDLYKCTLLLLKTGDLCMFLPYKGITTWGITAEVQDIIFIIIGSCLNLVCLLSVAYSPEVYIARRMYVCYFICIQRVYHSLCIDLVPGLPRQKEAIS